MIYVGIDPGVHGALAWFCHGGSGRPGISDGLLGVTDMPTIAAEGKKGRRIVDGPKLIRLLNHSIAQIGVPTAVLEEVRSMPRDGHVGAFAFGRCFGTIETALAAARIPFVTVRPQVWKKKLGVLADKDHARMIAGRLMPEGAENWPLKKHDGRAEAALIAYYGAHNT